MHLSMYIAAKRGQFILYKWVHGLLAVICNGLRLLNQLRPVKHGPIAEGLVNYSAAKRPQQGSIPTSPPPSPPPRRGRLLRDEEGECLQRHLRRRRGEHTRYAAIPRSPFPSGCIYCHVIAVHKSLVFRLTKLYLCNGNCSQFKCCGVLVDPKTQCLDFFFFFF